jgi:molybdopterin-guanine dinucleotide biosynthesis protein A
VKIGGIILCGGQSRRMGTSKAWLEFGAETLLERVARVVQFVVEPVVVVAARAQELPKLGANVFFATDEEAERGPLQGIAAGLAALEGRADAAYVSSCDVPFLHAALIQRVIDLLGDAAIAVPRVEDRYHPLAAVYRLSVLPAVKSLLRENRLRPFFLFDLVPTRVIEAAELVDVDPTCESLRNVNTPEDYQSALNREASAR